MSTEARPGREARPRLVTPLFLLVMASNFAYFTALGILIPVLPRYVDEGLGKGDVAVGVVIGSFAISAVMLRPLSGRLGDRRGRRLLVIMGGLLAALSMVGYVIADSLTLLVLLRVASGIGEAFFYVGVASAITDISPDERRGEALSYFSLALFGGLAVGPVIGESVLHSGDFDAVWIAAAVFAVVAGGLGFFIKETRPVTDIEASEAAAAAAVGWRRFVHPAAMVPGTVLAAAIWGLATFTSFTPLYALDLGMSGSRSVFAFYSVIVLLIRGFGARIPDRLGPARSARFALSFATVGLLTIGIWGAPVGLFVGTAIWSIGHSLAFPALMTMALKNAPVAERGAVVGTFTSFFDLSFGVGAMSAGGISATLGYRGAFVGAAGVAFAGLVMLYMRARARRTLVTRSDL